MNLTRLLKTGSAFLTKWVMIPFIFLFSACNENFTPTYFQANGPTIVIGGELVRDAKAGDVVEIEITLTAESGLSKLTVNGQEIAGIPIGANLHQLVYKYSIPQSASDNIDLKFTVADKMNQTASATVTLQLNPPVVQNPCEYELNEGVHFITRSMGFIVSSGNVYGIENNANMPDFKIGDILISNQANGVYGRITQLSRSDDFIQVMVSMADVSLEEVFSYLSCSRTVEIDEVLEFENISQEGARTTGFDPQDFINIPGMDLPFKTAVKEATSGNEKTTTGGAFTSTYKSGSVHFKCTYEFSILIEDSKLENYLDKLSDCRFTFETEYGLESTETGNFGTGANVLTFINRSVSVLSQSIGSGDFELPNFFKKTLLIQPYLSSNPVSGAFSFEGKLEIPANYSSETSFEFNTLSQRTNYGSDEPIITVNSLSGSAELTQTNVFTVGDWSLFFDERMLGTQSYGTTLMNEDFAPSSVNNSSIYSSSYVNKTETSFISNTFFAPYVSGDGITNLVTDINTVLLTRPASISLEGGNSQVGAPYMTLGEVITYKVVDNNENPVQGWGFRIDLPNGIERMKVIEIVGEGDEQMEIEHILERNANGRTTTDGAYIILYSDQNGLLRYKFTIEDTQFGSFTLLVQDGLTDGGTNITFEMDEDLFDETAFLNSIQDPLGQDFDFFAWWSSLSDNSKIAYNLILGNGNITTVPSATKIQNLRTLTEIFYFNEAQAAILALEGTQIFGSLTSMNLFGQPLTSLDLSLVNTLTKLSLEGTSLTSLNLSGLTNLSDLSIVGSSGLKEISLAGLTGLISINALNISFSEEELKTFYSTIECSVLVNQNLNLLVNGNIQNASQILQLAKIKCDPAFATSIATARASSGAELYIRGIVTTPDYGTSNGQFYLQDVTGGINVFHGGNNGLVESGDDVIIKGLVSVFTSGTIQIQPTLIEKISTANPHPSATMITTSDLNVDSHLQGSRVILENVYIKDFNGWPGNGSDRNFDAVVDGQEFVIRIEGGNNFFDNAEAPYGLFKLTGVLGRFNNDVQINPFFEGDIVLNEVQPTITANGSLNNFGEVENGQTSAVQSYSLSASNLIGNVTVTASAGFEISTGNSNFSSSLQIDQNSVSGTIINVRFTANSGTNGEKNGSITHSSLALRDVEVMVSGTETGNPEVVPEVFFSEYGEGSSNNKWIEVYNPTGNSIDFSEYTVELYSNGNTGNPNSTYNFSGTLAAGATYVLYNSSASEEVKSKGDDNSGVANFSGDDTLILKKNGIIIDVFGQFGFRPSNEWNSNEVASRNQTLVRKPGILRGDDNADDVFDPSVEWKNLGYDIFTNIGQHDINDQ